MGEQRVERLEVLIQVRGEDAGEHAGQVVAVPPAVHVGLAEAERAVRENPCVEPFVVHTQVAGPVAVDPDTRLQQQAFSFGAQ